jgi:hypothetical protein
MLHQRRLHEPCPVMHRQGSLEGKIDFFCASLDQLFSVFCNRFFFLAPLVVYLYYSGDEIRSIKYTMIKPLPTI